MDIDWKAFEHKIFKECTKNLDIDDGAGKLAEQIFKAASIAAMVAIRQYHEMISQPDVQLEKQSGK